MGLRLFFLPNFLGATFIQGATFIPDSSKYLSRENASKTLLECYFRNNYKPFCGVHQRLLNALLKDTKNKVNSFWKLLRGRKPKNLRKLRGWTILLP